MTNKPRESQADLNWISSYIWRIADEVLRDLFSRGKYRDVILPMTVIRRFDAVLEPTKHQVLEVDAKLKAAKVDNPDQALRQAAGQAFYNTSKFSLRDLKGATSQQQLEADFTNYLNGFSENVQQIIENFKLRQLVPELSKSGSLGVLLDRMLSPDINLGPEPVRNGDGSVRLPGLDNHAMGTVFEELLRRFNEANNEEAGEHWTPRDAVQLMTNLIFLPIKDQIESGTYLLYDGALGTGGMLTVADDTLTDLAEASGKQVSTHLFGQEINPESFAIAKADLLIKGEDADNIVGGVEYSTLSNDAFRGREFDFMLSNPPYGKNWKVDLERMGGKAAITDPRFLVQHAGDQDFSLIPSVSDGQMLFLANMVSKMKQDTPLGSRIAEVHNGSSLFTGDAGQGPSNIRRWIIENDWLEAIVALPLNMFYNTGIATYIWVLTNRKSEERRGKVQLIDVTKCFTPLRKNLGNKNCELAAADIAEITAAFLAFEDSEGERIESKIFENEAFGYWKVIVERPQRLRSQLTRKAINDLRFASGDAEVREVLHDEFGDKLFTDFPAVAKELTARVEAWGADETGDDDDDDEEEGKATPGLPVKVKKKLLDAKTWKRDGHMVEVAELLRDKLGEEIFDDHNLFLSQVTTALKEAKIKLPAAERKAILNAISWHDDEAPPVIKKTHKPGAVEPDPLAGRFEQVVDGKQVVVEYEPDSEFRDSEQVPLLEEGGIKAFIEREVLPYSREAWIKEADAKVGYEISFNRYFYKPPPLRSLDEIAADILALEKESEGLLDELLGGGSQNG